MEKMVIYILGHEVHIHYQISDRGYVQWKLTPSKDGWLPEHDLLDLLLRMHHNQYIEALCREEDHYIDYVRGQAPDLKDLPF